MRTVIYPTKLFIFGCLFGFIGYYITLQYELIPGMVSWYVPHGIKLVALFILPFRYWLFFLVGCNTGDNTYFYMFVDEATNSVVTWLQGAISFTVLEVITGAIIAVLARTFVTGSWISVNSMMWLILLSILYRLLYLAIAAYFGLGFYATIPQDVYVEYFIAQQVSGYLVGFYIFTFHLFWLLSKQSSALQNPKERTWLVTYIGLLGLVICVFLYVTPQFDYLLRIALFIPLILMATRFGGVGIMLTSMVVMSTLMGYLWQGPGEILLEYQPYLLSYALVTLLVAAVLNEKDQAQKSLEASKTSLEEQNTSLEKMTETLQVLGRNILNNQERERQFLSQELHDEVGQNVIALKTTIKVLEVEHGEPQQRITELKVRADDIYNSVYHLMHWLRPIILDDYGLYRTLEGPYFAKKLHLANIDYQIKRLDDMELSAVMETAIFRIVQEAVTNTVKHSNATTFCLDLYEAHGSVYLKLKDDGDKQHTPSTSHSGKFGLEGIHSRVAAFNGDCVISDSDGFVIEIKLPYERK